MVSLPYVFLAASRTATVAWLNTFLWTTVPAISGNPSVAARHTVCNSRLGAAALEAFTGRFCAHCRATCSAGSVLFGFSLDRTLSCMFSCRGVSKSSVSNFLARHFWLFSDSKCFLIMFAWSFRTDIPGGRSGRLGIGPDATRARLFKKKEKKKKRKKCL